MCVGVVIVCWLLVVVVVVVVVVWPCRRASFSVTCLPHSVNFHFLHLFPPSAVASWLSTWVEDLILGVGWLEHPPQPPEEI